MEVVKVYIPRSNLKKAVGVGYIKVLKALIEEGALLSYSDVLELRFDKEKARHIQSVLEFYEVKGIPHGRKLPSKVSLD